jgi:signal transduction histidine kinase/ActR/RegA family two-component response regulator
MDDHTHSDDAEHRLPDWQSLFDVFADPFLILRPTGEIIKANKAATRQLRNETGSLAGAPFAALVAIADVPQLDALLTRSSTHRQPGTKLRLQAANDDLRWYELLLQEGRWDGAAVIFLQARDIHRRVTDGEHLRRYTENLERRLAERTEALQHAQVELTRSLQMKDDILAGMTHELRTPLNAIRGKAEIMAEGGFGPLTSRQERAVNVILDGGRQMLVLINDLLDVARIEAGHLDLVYDRLRLQEICRFSLASIQKAAQQKDIQIAVQLDEQVGRMVGDGRRLKQILVNLLENAVKFTPQGGAIGLEMTGDAGRGQVSLVVWDNGPGIPVAQLERIFKPFVQLDSSLARQYSGTGLGLALVTHLVDIMEGGVHVVSVPGLGSRFVINLPWLTEAPPVLPPAVNGDDPVGPRILIINEKPHHADKLASRLRAAGFQISIAQSSVQALDLAAVTQPALILLQVQLHSMAGLDLIRGLRSHLELVQVPLIAIASLTLPGDRERYLQAGADSYLTKPLQHEALLQEMYRFYLPANSNSCAVK